MKRTIRVVVVAALVVGAFTVTGCSITIGSMGSNGQGPSPTSAGATYLALVGPLNTETFALDTAVFESPDDLTTPVTFCDRHRICGRTPNVQRSFAKHDLAQNRAARVRADLGLPPPAAPQVTLSD